VNKPVERFSFFFFCPFYLSLFLSVVAAGIDVGGAGGGEGIASRKIRIVSPLQECHTEP
jgi:hypothetical protein